jgi:hypothetical protein
MKFVIDTKRKTGRLLLKAICPISPIGNGPINI